MRVGNSRSQKSPRNFHSHYSSRLALLSFSLSPNNLSYLTSSQQADPPPITMAPNEANGLSSPNANLKKTNGMTQNSLGVSPATSHQTP